MRDLTIVFTKSKVKFPIGSLLIRWWLKTPYSHVAREFNAFDFKMYYQASEGRVNYESDIVFNQKHEILYKYTVQIPDDEYIKIVAACLKEAGIEYGLMQNVGIVYVWAVKQLFGNKISNPWKKGKNCSELILPILQKVFPNKFQYLDPNTVTPKDLYIRLEDLKREGLVI